MKVFSDFHPLLDALVALNKVHRGEFSKESAKAFYSADYYARNFCTVVCDIGRMSGKTEYIKRRADKDSLVIVHSVEAAVHLYGRRTPYTLCSARQLERVASAKKFKTIYVDEPALTLRSVGMDRLYRLLADASCEQTFVLLGGVAC